jgi:hypothetical protein
MRRAGNSCRPRLRHEDKFGFAENDLRCGFGTQIGFDSVETLFVCRGEFGVEGVVVEVKVSQMLGESGKIRQFVA